MARTKPSAPAQKPTPAGKKKKSGLEKESSKLFEYKLGVEQPDWALKLFARILAVGLLITAIVFGAGRIVFGLETRSIFGRGVDIELQLALLGLINKIMDLLVTISLEDLAAVALTLTLAGRPTVLRAAKTGGAQLTDFELGQELTKPWQSIAAFSTRCRVFGWSMSSFFRFFITLATSICVLLQGLSINTIGMPKERWYKQALQHYPPSALHDIDISFWPEGFQVAGSGDKAWNAAMIYSAAIAYRQLEYTAGTFGWSDRGWQPIGSEVTDVVVWIDTVVREGLPISGVAGKLVYAQQVFEWLHKNGSSPAQDAIGWNANLELLLPMVSTRCASNASIGLSPNRTAAARVLEADSSSFAIDISSMNADGLNDTSTTCELTVSQVVFPASTWIVSNAGTSVSFNGYRNTYNNTPRSVASSAANARIASRLAIQMGIILEVFDIARPNINTSTILRGNARRVQEAQASITRREDALAASLTVLATTLLGNGLWNMTMAEQVGETPMRATNIEWQVYGSGPRLGWQWVTIIVLSVLIASLLVGIVQSLWHRISPSEMLKPQGMLVAANLSSELSSFKVAKIQSGEAIKTVVSVKCDANKPDALVISDNSTTPGGRPKKRKKYVWEQ